MSAQRGEWASAGAACVQWALRAFGFRLNRKRT